MESAGVRYNFARVVDVRFLIQKQRVRKHRTTSYINKGKDMR